MIPFPTRPLPEVADILRAHGEAYTAHHPVTALQAAVMRRLAACRTAALGGHVDACGRCGYTRVSYNSCRDRHCPKCQGAKRAAWLEAGWSACCPWSTSTWCLPCRWPCTPWYCTIPVGCTTCSFKPLLRHCSR